MTRAELLKKYEFEALLHDVMHLLLDWFEAISLFQQLNLRQEQALQTEGAVSATQVECLPACSNPRAG